MSRKNVSRLLAVAMLAGMCASASQATSIGSPRPHDPLIACMSIEELVGDLNAGKPFGREFRHYREVHTDALGKLERDEIEGFNQWLLTSEGKPDRSPMTIRSIRTLGGDEIVRHYVLTTERTRWRTKRIELDEMLQMIEIDDPHWGAGYVTWLVAFNGNNLQSIRQADELTHIASTLKPLADCPRPQILQK